MTEWALARRAAVGLRRPGPRHARTTRVGRVRQFVRGGFWRNFKMKYPEANEMYARMMMVSRRLAASRAAGARGRALLGAPRTVSRPVQLPLLARRVRRHLSPAPAQRRLQPDDRRRQPAGPGRPARPDSWIEATVDDYNFDARQEVRLANDQLICLLAPAAADRCMNWTCARSPQSAGHLRAAAGGVSPASPRPERNTTIRMWPAFTTASCSNKRDWISVCSTITYLRKSMLDHFYATDANVAVGP